MSQTNTISKDDCWLYASHISKDGYGVFSYRINGKSTSTTGHKAMYEHHRGRVPSEMSLDHLCETKRCVNPDHLEIVTVSINSQRKATKRYCSNCEKLLSQDTNT